MYQIGKVSSKEAMKLIEYCVSQADKYGKPIAVAVAGPEGELIAFLRMDGTSPAASTIAQNKAHTSAVDRAETSKMGERMRGADNPMFWGDPRITGFGGGVPISQENMVIGGLGVSGLPEADDIIIALGAVREVFGSQ